ncbi:hypothetical protein Purlil1_7378 [Purpureocillium lilacinum]|uniref:Uncharacterized protein n=1 Tax=Purpureocillium lilacinum TaxID=33203 RepID=A0ABR0BW26_PURLI|nr:hypothetical protein Purlil1_7378 [Purpureocillium lilacinum]
MRYCNPTSGGLIRGPGGVLDILMHLTSCACQNCLGSGSPARGADGPSCTASVTACVTSKEDPRVVVCAAQLMAGGRRAPDGWCRTLVGPRKPAFSWPLSPSPRSEAAAILSEMRIAPTVLAQAGQARRNTDILLYRTAPCARRAAPRVPGAQRQARTEQSRERGGPGSAGNT